MQSASPRLLFLLSFVSIVLAACGGDPVPPVPTDAGPRDAQRPIDSGQDAQVVETDAQIPDAGDVDGGPGFDPGRCRADATMDVLTLATDSIARVRDVGVAAGSSTLAVAWSARDAEGFENVMLAEIPPLGEVAVAAQQLTTGTAIQRDPAIAPNGRGWTLAWYGNPEGGFEVYSGAWEDGRLVTGGSIQRLTENSVRDDATTLLATSSGALAGWVESVTDTERVPRLRPLSVAAAPTGATQTGTTASTAVGRFVLAPRAGGLSLAWVESGTATPSARLQPLDASGAPTGTPITLSTEANLDGSLGLASDAGGGAVVFGTSVAGIRPEVRARLIDGSGTPSGSERVITEAPLSGRDASIAKVFGGYVIAYRSLGATPMLRVELRDADLELVSGLDLVAVQPSGGAVTVRVSGEGRMIVGWADVDVTAGTTAIRAVRIRCD